VEPLIDERGAVMHPTPQTPPADDDAGSTRRTFIAGTGAAAVLGAAAVATAGPAAASTPTRGDDAAASGDAVVAYLRDPARGEVRLLSGEHEVVVHDPELARALARHAARPER
jgi:hypothetical protein